LIQRLSKVKYNFRRLEAEVTCCLQIYQCEVKVRDSNKMSGLGLARSLQRSSKIQTRGVAFEAAIIAAAAKKVHMTLSKNSSGVLSALNSMEYSLDGEEISYKAPVVLVNNENYDDYAILESARAKELHDSLQNVVTLRPIKSEQYARI